MNGSKYWSRGGAEYSDCKLYRYVLWRDLNPSFFSPIKHGQVLWVMLNPSTATEHQDDPTVRRCVAFSAGWGFSRVVVCNLWAFRATEPIDLVAHVLEHGSEAAAGGARNDQAIRAQAEASELVVAAWGAHVTGRALKRSGQPERITELLQGAGELRCLGVTAAGCPKHPLYARGDSELVRFPPA